MVNVGSPGFSTRRFCGRTYTTKTHRISQLIMGSGSRPRRRSLINESHTLPNEFGCNVIYLADVPTAERSLRRLERLGVHQGHEPLMLDFPIDLAIADSTEKAV